MAVSNPDRARNEAVRRVSQSLWSVWQPSLSQAGIPADRFNSVLDGASREIWLWVMGERGFDEVVDSLIGRVRRRL